MSSSAARGPRLSLAEEEGVERARGRRGGAVSAVAVEAKAVSESAEELAFAPPPAAAAAALASSSASRAS